MRIKFFKYQGTGNDFVMIDDRNQKFPVAQELVERLCDRRFGVGADGLILLQKEDDIYKMVYFNSDGNESTMCGNGGRCFVQFLKDLDIIKNKVQFKAIDGLHEGEVINSVVQLGMANVDDVTIKEDYAFLDTGSPHHIVFRDNLKDIDVKAEGAAIRYSALYPEGTNVNFVRQLSPNRLEIRTYERGVEDETLSCGTGVTAAAITMAATGKTQHHEISVKTQGGNLMVKFNKIGMNYSQVQLIGSAEFVFEGKIKI